jgi:hypothetical protein
MLVNVSFGLSTAFGLRFFAVSSLSGAEANGPQNPRSNGYRIVAFLFASQHRLIAGVIRESAGNPGGILFHSLSVKNLKDESNF